MPRPEQKVGTSHENSHRHQRQLEQSVRPRRQDPEPPRIQLAKDQLPHYFQDDGSHPLDGIEIVVSASAGDGYIRRMKKRGAAVLLTGKTDPLVALQKVLAGEALADTRFDITTVLCKLRDVFSHH